ncbi:MAG TPA: N-methyl-L-tryptophan oxidase [Chloroflexota bacterium]|nr:N-methyl-L-tryptophan oxidase [Chloroflexota bacterium]
MPTYDAIVLGLGGMGSASAYHLARRGQRVLGLDAFPPGHANGASHGHSRIIREAYYEAPEYVPLVQRAYALWRALEETSGRALLRITGGINAGAPDSRVVTGVVASARRHGLAYELLSAAETAARFPGFRLGDELVAVYQPNSGVLDPEACVRAHLDGAAGAGAELRFAEPVRRWAPDGEGVTVRTDAATYRAGRLVITAGPWAAEQLDLAARWLTVRRIVNVHFRSERPDRFGVDRFPVFGLVVPEGQYYGVPDVPGQGLKLGRHDGGEVCTAGSVRREVDPEEVASLRAVLDRYLPGAAGEVLSTLTCLYTMSPDGHFVLDRYPGHPQVVYGCGFSGHGFKFCSVIGETLADLAVDGRTERPVGFLAAGRLAAAPAAATG